MNYQHALRSVLCVGDHDTEALPEPDELGVQLLRGDIRIAIRQEGVEQISRVFVPRRVVQAAAQRGDLPAALQLLPVNLMAKTASSSPDLWRRNST